MDSVQFNVPILIPNSLTSPLSILIVLQAEMLSFLNSKSAAFVKRIEDRDSRPDENFAREIMVRVGE